MDARHWHQLVTFAEKEIADLRQGLPRQLREPAAGVPVVFQPWIDGELAGTEIEPDVLGLYVGTPRGSDDATDAMLPQIFLFLESIWTAVEADPEAYCEEVGVTYLHELGHFLGLDETDLELRGLE